jgi:hypothetical protein
MPSLDWASAPKTLSNPCRKYYTDEYDIDTLQNYDNSDPNGNKGNGNPGRYRAKL